MPAAPARLRPPERALVLVGYSGGVSSLMAAQHRDAEDSIACARFDKG